MKKVITVLILAAFLLNVAGCSSNGDIAEREKTDSVAVETGSQIEESGRKSEETSSKTEESGSWTEEEAGDHQASDERDDKEEAAIKDTDASTEKATASDDTGVTESSGPSDKNSGEVIETYTKNVTPVKDTEDPVSEGKEEQKEAAGDAQQDPSAPEQSELAALSEELALQMAGGDFKETFDLFTPIVKLQITKEALTQAWDATVNGMGDYRQVRKITEETNGKNQIVSVILDYENSGIKVLFSYNTSKKLEGLWINYAPFEAETVTNDAFEETDISVGKGDNPLEGILTLPKKVKNPPVAILVHGSGTHDEDESIGSNKPFRDLAHGLAKQGIAVIRYKESGLENAGISDTIEEDSLNDAAKAIQYAQSCGKVDADRIYIIGHSLGGMMAPKIAADNKDVDGIVSLAGSPRKLEDIILDQNRILLKADKTVTEAMFNLYVAQVRTAVDKIKSLKEDSSEVILGYPASYWYSLNRIDIPKIAKGLEIPILIAQGSADFQVYADIDYKVWQELLADKDNVTFRLYDNLNHLFMASKGKMDTSEYNIKDTVDPLVIDDIAQWILSNEN